MGRASAVAVLALTLGASCVAVDSGERAVAADVAAVLSIHHQILQAHVDRDPEVRTALEADTVMVASRGDVFTAARDERLEMRRSYLGATRFSVYRDVKPPVVRVSGDGTMAWLYANVEVVAHRAQHGDGADAAATGADSSHVVWAWIELYEKRNGKWLLTGNVSNYREA